MFFDQYYLILVVPTLLFSLIAQFMVKTTFSKYSKIQNKRNLTGSEVAKNLMRINSISDVKIEEVAGSLSDHYDPSTKTLRLSQSVYDESSIAAVGVAAHEAGHAIQHSVSYSPLALRSYLVPVANIGSAAGPYVALAGLFFRMPFLLNLGIILFSGAVLFYLVTLPVEFNASNRAIALLKNNGILSEKELAGVKKVLTAAALTYVASALTAVASLFRLLLLSRDNRN